MEDLAVAFRGVAKAAGGHTGGAVEGADEVREVSEADVEGDVGGFGAGSEFAYWASAFMEWRFSRVFSVAAGYSVLDFDRHFTFARERFKWNARISGPTLALSFKF